MVHYRPVPVLPWLRPPARAVLDPASGHVNKKTAVSLSRSDLILHGAVWIGCNVEKPIADIPEIQELETLKMVSYYYEAYGLVFATATDSHYISCRLP